MSHATWSLIFEKLELTAPPAHGSVGAMMDFLKDQVARDIGPVGRRSPIRI